MDVAIGPARVREAEQILKLQYLCYQSEAALHDDYTLPPLTQTLADLLAAYDTHHILVARLGEAGDEGAEVVGSIRGCMADGGTCHVGRLMVHPRVQRRGLGVRLMRALEGHFVAADRYELFTGPRSEGNVRLYHRLGYTLCQKDGTVPDAGLVYLEKQRAAAPSEEAS